MENSTLTVKAPADGVTPVEREHAARYLAVTRDRLAAATKGVSEAQWTFRPSPDRWSLAEIMEHIAIIEERVGDIVGKMPEAPADAPVRDIKGTDVAILVDVPCRYPRVKAPDRVAPIGAQLGAESLEKFLKSRARMEGMLASAPHLRGHAFLHPIFGPWDGYQWILAAGGHCSRHTSQILEVKADLNFPAA